MDPSLLSNSLTLQLEKEISSPPPQLLDTILWMVDEMNVDIECVDAGGRTVLHVCANFCSEPTPILALLSRGAPPLARTTNQEYGRCRRERNPVLDPEDLASYLVPSPFTLQLTSTRLCKSTSSSLRLSSLRGSRSIPSDGLPSTRTFRHATSRERA